MEEKTILIADDDIDLLEQTKSVVEGAGYKTITADSEKSAMEIPGKHPTGSCNF